MWFFHIILKDYNLNLKWMKNFCSTFNIFNKCNKLLLYINLINIFNTDYWKENMRNKTYTYILKKCITIPKTKYSV